MTFIVILIFCFGNQFQFNGEIDSYYTLLPTKGLELSFSIIIGVCLPLVLDIVVDFTRRNNAKYRQSLFVIKIPLLVGLLPSSIYFTSSVFNNISSIDIFFISLIVWRDILVMASFFIQYYLISKTLKVSRLYYVFVLLSIGRILLSVSSPEKNTKTILFAFGSFFMIVGIILYFYFHKRKYKSWLPNLNSHNIILPTYIISFCIPLLIFGPFDISQIFYSNMLTIFFATLNAILYRDHIWMKNSTDLLELKQSFVRYIGHEMRTPLNVSCIGIAMLQEELLKEKVFYCRCFQCNCLN